MLQTPLDMCSVDACLGNSISKSYNNKQNNDPS